MQAAEVVPQPTSDLRSTLPPGPRSPGLVQSLLFALNPYRTVARTFRRYGDRCTVHPVGQGTTVVFADPEGIRDIFTDDGETLRSGEAVAPLLGPIAGWNSLLLLDGARHLRERRLMGPPFHGERMHVYGELMREIADRAIDRWPLGSPFPIHKEMQSITLDVILLAAFVVDEGG